MAEGLKFWALCFGSRVCRFRSWVQTYSTHQPFRGGTTNTKWRKSDTDISSRLIVFKQKEKEKRGRLATGVSSGLIFLSKKKRERENINFVNSDFEVASYKLFKQDEMSAITHIKS